MLKYIVIISHLPAMSSFGNNLTASLLPGISRLLAALAPLIILFVFSKFIAVEELGLLNYFVSLITIIGVLTDFGLPEAVQRFLPQKEQKENTILQTLVLEFAIVIISALILLPLDFVLNGSISKGYLLALFICVVASAANVVMIIFNGLRQHNKVSVYYILNAASFIIISVALLPFTDGVTAFFVGRIVSWAAFLIIPLIDLARQNLLNGKLKFEKRFIIFALNTFVAAFAYVMFTQWDSIIVTNNLGEYQNGIYKSLVFVASAPLALRIILETKLLPDFSKLFSEGNIKELRLKTQNLTLVLLIGLVVVCVGAFLLGELALLILYNAEVANGARTLFTILTAATFVYIAAVPAISYLQAVGKESIIRNLSILQAFVFIVLSIPVLQSHGTIGLAILLLCLNFFLFVGLTLAASRK